MEVARSRLWAPVFIYSTNILIRFANCKYGELSSPKNQKMASDLQAFLVFSQHPKWVITPVNP